MSYPLDTYLTKQETQHINGKPYYIKSLKDQTQYSDPEGAAESLGISATTWPISGILWPSGIVLAEIISKIPLANLRILEVGCGIGLASLVATARGGDITASDYHPLTQSLLKENATLNNLPSIRYFQGDWRKPITNRGVFDLVIGSDLLYDKDNLEILATFINCHLSRTGKVLLIDPQRKLTNKFIKIMAGLNFNCTNEELITGKWGGESPKYKSCIFKRLKISG